MIAFYAHKKHKKNTRHQKALKSIKTRQNANKQIKIQNALKKHLSGKK